MAPPLGTSRKDVTWHAGANAPSSGHDALAPPSKRQRATQAAQPPLTLKEIRALAEATHDDVMASTEAKPAPDEKDARLVTKSLRMDWSEQLRDAQAAAWRADREEEIGRSYFAMRESAVEKLIIELQAAFQSRDAAQEKLQSLTSAVNQARERVTCIQALAQHAEEHPSLR